MPILKRIGLVLSASFLKLSLFTLAITLAVVSVFGTPDHIKASLADSGIYDRFVGSTIRQNADKQDLIPLERPEIQAAAESAFNPQLLQESSESFIDGFYGWLEGRTEEPEFTIDITEAKSSFIQRVADYAEERVRDLRPCTIQESQALSRQEINPFTLECRPPIDVSAEKQRLINNLENDDDFLPDTVLTPADMQGSDSDDLSFQSSSAPENFQTIKKLPVVLGVVTLVLVGLVILLSQTRLQGIKRVGVISLGTGVFIFISSFIFTALFNNMNRPGGLIGTVSDSVDSEVQQIVFSIVETLHGAFNRSLFTVAVVYAVAGAAILLALYLQKRKPEKSI